MSEFHKTSWDPETSLDMASFEGYETETLAEWEQWEAHRDLGLKDFLHTVCDLAILTAVAFGLAFLFMVIL